MTYTNSRDLANVLLSENQRSWHTECVDASGFFIWGADQSDAESWDQKVINHLKIAALIKDVSLDYLCPHHQGLSNLIEWTEEQSERESCKYCVDYYDEDGYRYACEVCDGYREDFQRLLPFLYALRGQRCSHD